MKKKSVTLIQKPFRCTNDMNVKLNKSRGALLLKTGNNISENSFLIMLAEIGLTSIEEELKIKEVKVP